MKRLVLGTAALVAAVLVFALLTLPPGRLILVEAAGEGSPPPSLVRGAWHVHTVRSDGTGTVDGVAAAAARDGLRFVIFSDHGPADRDPDPPAYRHGVLCLDAVEISTFHGHYAAIGLGRAPYRLAGEGRDVIEDVARLGGFGIIAHPDSGRASLRWTQWDGIPVGALEWLNADSEWRNDSPAALGRVLLAYPFRSREAIVRLFSRPVTTFARWDHFTRFGPVVGLAAHDAHARFGLRGEADPNTSPGGLFLGLPSYEAVFGAFSLGVNLGAPLSGRATADAQRLIEAIRAGHLHTVIDALAGPAWIDFRGEADGAAAIEGDQLERSSRVTLSVRAPSVPGESIVLLRAGHVVARRAASTLRYDVDGSAGAYRAEVHLPSEPGTPPVPWIVSNPIYVGPFERRQEPPARPAPSVSTRLDASAAAWTVEQDRTSRAVLESGDGDSGVAVFRYQIGSGQRGLYAALVHAIGGLPAFDRVSFRARADRPMRLSVQLRQPGTGDGYRWARSVYLDTTPRDVTLFGDDFRITSPEQPAHPTIATLDAVLFVVDTLNTEPGTCGKVWLEGVRLER